MSTKTNKRQKDLETLKTGYNSPIRIFEILSIFSYFIIMGVVFWQIKDFFIAYPWIAILACIGGWIAADLLSGILHWFFDTWGQYNWPILGKLFVRPFLEHHINPKGITDHDWVETNGSTFFAGITVLGLILFFGGSEVILTMGFFGCSWGCLTNQFHKWAHQPPSDLPKVVLFLQNVGIFLSKKNHDRHHQEEFTQHYCITNGFLNPFYDRIGLFRVLEKVITKITGVKPRDNDLSMEDKNTSHY